MDPHFVQALRYKLQRRIRRLNSVAFGNFGPTLKQIWPVIRKNELFMGILAPVLQHRPDLEESADKIIQSNCLHGEDEQETVGIAFHILEKVAAAPDATRLAREVAARYGHQETAEEYLDVFRELFVEPIYEYLDEQLDEQRAIVALLLRYKHRSEWFNRKCLLKSATEDPKHAEELLAQDLYLFLHDQGFTFEIEPKSVSGRVDLLAGEGDEDELVLDAKVFDGKSRGKPYLVKGFNQIYTYARDHNKSVGYLTIFQIERREPRFTFAPHESVFPVIEHNGKLVYFVVIDICAHDKSASKRGAADVVEITHADLLPLAE